MSENPAELLKKQKKIRGGHRAHLKKLYGAADAILQSFDDTKEVELKRMKESMLRKSGVIAQLDEGILQFIEDEEEMLEEIEAAEATHSNLQSKVEEIDGMLRRVAGVKSEGTRSSGTNETNSGVSTPVQPTQTVKLPKLEIEKFSRDP